MPDRIRRSRVHAQTRNPTDGREAGLRKGGDSKFQSPPLPRWHQKDFTAAILALGAVFRAQRCEPCYAPPDCLSERATKNRQPLFLQYAVHKNATTPPPRNPRLRLSCAAPSSRRPSRSIPRPRPSVRRRLVKFTRWFWMPRLQRATINLTNGDLLITTNLIIDASPCPTGSPSSRPRESGSLPSLRATGASASSP